MIESDGGEYDSLKVSELRELLRSRGLGVSGIKAQLVERLGTGIINPRRVGNSRPMEKTTAGTTRRKKETATEKGRWTNSTGERRERRSRRRNERPLGKEGEGDNANMDGVRGDFLESTLNDGQRDSTACRKERREDARKEVGEMPLQRTIKYIMDEPTKEVLQHDHDLQERIEDLNRQLGVSSFVFAKDGEEESEDEWDSDDDDVEEFDTADGLEFEEGDDDCFDPNETADIPPPSDNRHIGGERIVETAPVTTTMTTTTTTFNDNFQGTRVFVQGLPEEATWKDLKDHFKRALPKSEVVFASVSIDKRTGKSKQCGIVQFDTPDTAMLAIREMRNHPMDGARLYVRGDVQESSKRDESRDNRGGNGRREEEKGMDRKEGKKLTIATKWKRANDRDEDGGGDDAWYNLKDEELIEIEDLIQKRDAQRRQNNYKMSDKLRETLKEEYGVHLDDRLKLWWTDTKHGGVPGVVSEIKGEGRWGTLKPWKQLPTVPECDALVDSDVVMRLLSKRDGARKRRDYKEADELLQKAYDAAGGGRPGAGSGGGLSLRIHDESRTWRIWTERPPPKKDGVAPSGYEKLTAGEMCIRIVEENEPDKVEEMKAMLRKFPGREWNVFKRLKGRYSIDE